MEITRITKKYVSVAVTSTLLNGQSIPATTVDVALLHPRDRPNISTTWTNLTVTNGVVVFMLAGPDADGQGALVAPAGGSTLWARVRDFPEVDAVLVEQITVK